MSKYFLIPVLLTIFVICKGQGNGPVVTVISRAYFSDLVGGKSMTACRPQEDMSFGGPVQNTCGYYSYATPPVSQGRWGNPATVNGSSGLGFDAVNSQKVGINTDFFLGQLTHFNWPITNAASGVTLNVIFQIRDSANSYTIGEDTYRFAMAIDETPNSGTCVYPGTVKCSDKISFQDSLNFQRSFSIGDISYTIRLQGFKENNQSSSSAIDYFISNEGGASKAYLFGRITAACPKQCVNNASYVINTNSECQCDCRSVTCSNGKITTPNCSCVCPQPNKCLNGGILQSDCTCQCPACGPNKILNPNDCSCTCDTAYCNSGTVKNLTGNVCECNCPSTPCSIQNEVRNNVCNCVCNKTCTLPKIEDPRSGVCDCVCNNTCGAGFTPNLNTCGCDCTKTCPNGQKLNSTLCLCTDCVGDWVKDTNGLCTICNLTQSSCGPNERLDTTACKCVCDRLNCSLFYDGQVVDTSKFCSCRNCTAGECICGNGKVEPGEDCDTGTNYNPCCLQCKWSRAPCNDSNACTTGDTCNGNGTCRGDYKCPPSHDCGNVTCHPDVGICKTIPFANFTTCGGGAVDLCAKRCVGGVCVRSPIVCPSDNDATDCMTPKCNPLTGTCPYVPINGTGCTDGDGCTTDDTCVSGVCKGKQVVCPVSTNPCQNSTCVNGICAGINLPTGLPCDADNNKCTIGDMCIRGNCVPGTKTVCETTDQCKTALCEPTTGFCYDQNLPNTDIACNDQQYCTWKDRCVNGTCVGDIDPALVNQTICGGAPPNPTAQTTVPLAIILSVAGAAALIGAIAGAAFLIKKVRDSKLMDPETWNPDSFSSIGANPLYKGSEKIVDNRLYEGTN